MNQLFAFLIVATAILAIVSAYPANLEDEAEYLQTARQIIHSRVSRSPQYGRYNSHPNYGYSGHRGMNRNNYNHNSYGHPGRRMGNGYGHHNNHHQGGHGHYNNGYGYNNGRYHG
ncbi:unnamed protein product [Orchesella dallaii]|uniref:Uncharacterized protein n=1 Tax=Orchesella dallaii TaxID=48710 RepID=A0ABP1RV40_9HEXA